MGKIKAIPFGEGFSPPSNVTTIPISDLKTKYLRFTDSVGFAPSTWKTVEDDWNRLEASLESAAICDYSCAVGEAYLSVRKANCKSVKSEARMIYVLNCLVDGREISPSAPPPAANIPEEFAPYYEEYISSCIEKGNKKQTLACKRRYARYLFTNLYSCGCRSLNDLTPDLVLQSTQEKIDDRCWGHYRMILSFLSEEGYLEYDYSALVPKANLGFRMPDVYTKEEVLKLEAAVDRSTPLGKRDYAIIVIASRLNLRNSDIADLTFETVDFDSRSINIFQRKTGEALSLPLVDEVETALHDYIDNARPASDDEHIFIRKLAPHSRLQPASIYEVVSKAFKNSGIQNQGRRKGAQALRASGATAKINSGIPYPLVRKSLGHRSDNAIRHYAKVDVEPLRKCALDPPAITEGSLFASFLRGGVPVCR